LVFFFIQSNLHAQHPVWPQPGAEWEICRFSASPIVPENYTITPSIRYEKDTLIDNTTYQVSRKLHTNGQLVIEYFTRFEQDTIFRYVNGNEYMFFTYNVLVGDTLFPLRTGEADYDQDTCSYTLELMCLDIYPINIDGNMLNLYEFLDVGNSMYGTNGSGQTTKYYWIEIIGWVSSFPWLIVPGEGVCNEIEFDGGLEFPIYYTDSTRSWPIEFQENGAVCDTLLSVEQEHFEQISIYPNPTSINFTIQLYGNYNTSALHYKLMDLTGKVVQKGSLTNTISVSDVESGIYVVYLEDDGKPVGVRKVVVEK
jgi:hypothetical protein